MNTKKNSLFVLEAVTFTKKRRRHKDDYQPFTTKVSFISFYITSNLKKPKMELADF